MEIEMEQMPFIRRPDMGAFAAGQVQDLMEWADVWYRLDEGRGKITLDKLEGRIRRTVNNAQAIPQAISILHKADYGQKGCVEYKDFRHFYNKILPESSWERAVLMRAALDVEDMTPTMEEVPWMDVWTKVVDFAHSKPSKHDFDWRWLLPQDYNRQKLLNYVYYRSELIHPSRIKDWILTTKEADRIPNGVAIQLLKKAEVVERADSNRDGYVEFEEFLRFAMVTSSTSRRSEAFRRGALVVLPRSKRTLETRQYLEEYSCCPPPLFMPLASLAEVAVFIYYAVDMGVTIGPNGPCPTYSPLVYHPQRRYEAWRYISYALIHSGWVHLVNNLLVQVFFGILLEMVHRWWRVMIVYLSGVAAGALAHSIFTPTAFLAGASGGVYAVEYAHLGNLFMNWPEMERPWLQLFVLLLLISLDFGYAIWDTYFALEPSNTGHMAHFGGAVAGVLVGVVVLRNLEKETWEKYCWWFSLVLFLVVITTGVMLNVFLPVPGYFPEDIH